MHLSSPLLVVGAVPHETRLVAHVLGARPVETQPWSLLRAGDTGVLTCGVGPANAAGALAWALATGPFAHVVNLGSAGSFDIRALPLEAVAAVHEDRFVDLGTRQADGAWKTGEDLRLMLGVGETNTLPCTLPFEPGRAEALAQELGFPVAVAGGTTVHHVCGTLAAAAERRELADGALVESMEGAALALVAARFGVPFSQLRGISNEAGAPRGGWRFEAAGRNAQRLLLRLIEREVP